MKLELQAILLGSLVLLGCSKTSEVKFQGYVEGDYVYVSSSQSGRLDQLAVQRGQQIAAKSGLFALDAEREIAAQQQAQQQMSATKAQWEDLLSGRRAPEVAAVAEQLRQAQAQARDAELQWQRNSALFKQNAVAQSQLDDSLASRDASAARVRELQNQLVVAQLPARDQQISAAKAQYAAAQAALRQADWVVAQKSVAAPHAGVVIDTLYRVGEWVNVGSPVIKLLPPSQIKLRFFIPEPALSQFKLGMRIKATCDGCSGDIPAKVDFISSVAEFTPPVIYSEQTRSKLVFRVEAVPDQPEKLNVGQPITVTR